MFWFPIGKGCWLLLWPTEALKLLARLEPEERRRLIRRTAHRIRELRMRPNPLVLRR